MALENQGDVSRYDHKNNRGFELGRGVKLQGSGLRPLEPERMRAVLPAAQLTAEGHASLRSRVHQPHAGLHVRGMGERA